MSTRVRKEGAARGVATSNNPKQLQRNRFKAIQDAHDEIIDAWIDTPARTVDPTLHSDKRLDKDARRQNLVHRAIEQVTLEGKTFPSEALDYIEDLIVEKPELFFAEDVGRKIPMVQAAEDQVALLFRVTKLLMPKEIHDKIKTRCKKGETQCPLHRVAPARRKECTTLRKPGKSQDTEPDLDSQCLHHSIDVERLVKKDDDLRRKLKELLSKESLAFECLEALLSDKKFDPGRQGETPVIERLPFESILGLCHDKLFDRPREARPTLLQRAIELYECPNLDYELLFSVIQALINRFPASIFHKSTKGTNVYLLLQNMSTSKSSQNENSRSRTKELLRRTCIGFPGDGGRVSFIHLSDDQLWTKKWNFLYSDVESERQFHLNLTGESVMLDRAYIDTVKTESCMRLETALHTVKLPYWKPTRVERVAPIALQDAHSPIERDQYVGEPEESEANPYVSLFDWLWESNVRKIFSIEVDDDGAEPHTNASIRRAFRGGDSEVDAEREFEIEIWNWKKFDICAETVAFAAPEAREICLYSRGNTAVLRGWASSPGLASLKHVTKLEIKIYPKNEDDRSDCFKYELEFKKTLIKNSSSLKFENIEITYPDYDRDASSRANGDAPMKATHDPLLNPEIRPNTNEWIKQLKPFASFLRNMQLPHKPSIKVALLDDGAKLTDLHGLEGGRSFRADKAEFFVGPCEHGTAMARCIREVWPMAKLYIARLDDSGQVENQRFTIMSCHQALRWALDMGVDIISMSWSFKANVMGNDTHEKIFRNLVREATTERNVILFGSLPDKGATVNSHQFLPVGMDEVIKIGAASIYGEGSKENLHSTPEFLLPGENLLSPSGETVAGSSYATAYASGLAAMVLYCFRAYQNHELSSDDDIEMMKQVDMARTVKGMRIMFRRLGQKDASYQNDRGIFLKPYNTFRSEFGSSSEDAWRVLMRIINEVLPGDVVSGYVNS